MIASLTSVTLLGTPVSVFAEEKDIPINIIVEATPINVTLPTSIELVNAGNTVDITAASTNKIVNNANTGTVYIDSINLETLNDWSLGDKTAKYEEMAKDSKHLYLGVKLSDEADFANLKESYIPVSKEIKAKAEKNLLFEGKANIASSKSVSQVGNLIVTVSESDNVVQTGTLKRGFLGQTVQISPTAIKELSFVTTQDEINVDRSWDASVEQNGSVMAWLDKNNLNKVFVGAKNGKVIAPEDSSWLLSGIECVEIIDVTNLDVSNVTNMSKLFNTAGGVCENSFTIKGLDTWDVSNVTDMSEMFWWVGGHVKTNVDIGDLSNWDVSNVTNMADMFTRAGYQAATFNIGNLEHWNVSNVTNMSGIFEETGASSSFVPPSWYNSKEVDPDPVDPDVPDVGPVDPDGPSPSPDVPDVPN